MIRGVVVASALVMGSILVGGQPLRQLPRFLGTKRLGAKSSSSRFSIVIAAVGNRPAADDSEIPFAPEYRG